MAHNRERVAEPIPRRPDQLDGRRLILRIEEHLCHLHRQPAHGNRCFFYDQLVIAHLLAFFNPLLHSLRRIANVFELPAVRRRFGIRVAPTCTAYEDLRAAHLGGPGPSPRLASHDYQTATARPGADVRTYSSIHSRLPRRHRPDNTGKEGDGADRLRPTPSCTWTLGSLRIRSPVGLPRCSVDRPLS